MKYLIYSELQLYTTAVYKYMNGPLRDDERHKRREQCPLPITTHFAQEGIKKLRQIEALRMQTDSMFKRQASDLGLVQSTKRSLGVSLWRGMRNMKVKKLFARHKAKSFFL